MKSVVRPVPWLILAACVGLGSYQFIQTDGSSSIEEGVAGLEAAVQALPRTERVVSRNLGDAKRAIESELGKAESLIVARLSAGETALAEAASAAAAAEVMFISNSALTSVTRISIRIPAPSTER